MKKFLLLVFVLLSQTHWILAQTGMISGKIKTTDTDEILGGANINLLGTSRGTISNQKGEFQLRKVPVGVQKIRIRYIGYQEKIQEVTIIENETINLTIKLMPAIIQTQGVLVTSSRYEKELADVSLPVTIVTSKQIDNTAPLTLVDAMKSEPGLALSRDGIWGTRLVVRGLSRNNLVTLIDGNRLESATDLAADLAMIDVNDIERIEVIRGSGSALYGSGAIGGVINVITRNGYYSDQFHIDGGLSGGISSVNKMGNGHAHFNMGDSRWFFYLSSMYRQAQDVQTPAGKLLNSQFTDNNISTKAGFKLFENSEIKLIYQNFQAEDVGIPGGGTIFPVEAEVRYPVEKRENLSFELVSRNWTSWLRQTSFKYFKQNIKREVENIPFTVKLMPGQPPKRVSVLKVTPGAMHHIDGFQFQSDWYPTKNQYFIAGVDYWQRQYDGHRSKFQKIEVLNPIDNSVTKTTLKEIGELPLPDSKYVSFGIFGQNELRIWHEKLVFTFGGRYDWINIQNDEALNPEFEITDGVRNDNPAGQTVLWVAGDSKNKSWSANFSLLYHLHPNFKLKFTTAKSFRSPALEERYQFIDLGNLVKIGDPDLQPERGMFGDLGFELSLYKFALSGNAFLNQIDDMVVDEPTTYENRAALKKVNVGQARLTGFDGRIDWEFKPSLTLYGTVGYVKGEDIKNNVPLPLIPPLNGRLGLRWKSPFYFNLDFSSNMYATQDRIVTEELRTPGYTTFDVFLNSYPLTTRFMVSRLVFGVENVTNRLYRNHLATNRGLIVAEPGRNFVVRWLVDF